MNRNLVALATSVALLTGCGTHTESGATNPNPGQSPVVSATANVTSGVAPLAVNFVGVAAGGTGTLTYKWDFGDGSVATTAAASHTYAADGTFTATFKATDAAAHFGTATVTIAVGARNAPAVTAAADHTAGLAPMVVNFTSNVTGGVAPVTVSWNFGDGAVAADPNPAHTYATAGSYGATVTAHDATGGSASATVLIQVGSGSKPVVTISANPTSGAAPLPVAFTAQAVGGNGALTYAWSFGDGVNATTMNANHTYAADGSYTANLTVTDASANTAVASVTIVVNSSTSSTLPDLRVTNIGAYATGLDDAYEPNDGAAYYLGDYGTGNQTYTINDGYIDTIDATFYADVTNFGAATTTPFYVDFYKDTPNAPQDGDYGDDYQQIQSLDANATQRLYFTVSDPAPGTSTTSWIKADSLSEVDEMDETNNVSDGLDATINGDVDYFSVYETSGEALKVDLTNLPADYDLELYDDQGTLVASSASAGLTAESITYTTTKNGLWTIKVFGYNGARSSTSPYTLTVLVP